MSGSTSKIPRAVAVGAVCGMRTLLLPALVARSARKQVAGAQRNSRSTHLLGFPAVSSMLSLAAVGELIGDKLPFTPDRTEPPSLAARAVSAALTTATLAPQRRPVMPSAVLAAASAVVSAHLMMRLRKQATRWLPDPLVAIAEDCLAVALANTVMHSATNRRG